MTEMSPKMAAAVAGVMAYIQTEEEAVLAAATAVPAPPRAPSPAPPMKLWGVSGRLEQMQLRNQMQLKAFHGLRRG